LTASSILSHAFLPAGVDVISAVVLILAGLAGAFLNTVASSGSAVTLPILIALGVEPVVANASNRVPIVIGCATAAWRFHRAGHLPWRDGIRFAIPAVLGAILGSLVASMVGDGNTTALVTFAVVFAFILLCANPSRWLAADRTDQPPNRGPLVMLLIGAVGVWAGLIAVDSATFALAALILVGHYAIREANGIKVMALGAAALVSVLVFWSRGEIDWAVAAWLGLGSIAGALLGARLALGPHAAKWVFRLLLTVLVIEVVRLAFTLVG
jgi:uncharacterized membrane protein YfcA